MELAQVVEHSLSIWEVVGSVSTFSRLYPFHPNLWLTAPHLPAYWTNWEHIRHFEHSHLDVCFPYDLWASSKAGLHTPYLLWGSRSINLSFVFCFFRAALVPRDIARCSLSPFLLQLGLPCGSVLRRAGQSKEGSSQLSCQHSEMVAPGDQKILGKTHRKQTCKVIYELLNILSSCEQVSLTLNSTLQTSRTAAVAHCPRPHWPRGSTHSRAPNPIVKA